MSFLLLLLRLLFLLLLLLLFAVLCLLQGVPSIPPPTPGLGGFPWVAGPPSWDGGGEGGAA